MKQHHQPMSLLSTNYTTYNVYKKYNEYELVRISTGTVRTY